MNAKRPHRSAESKAGQASSAIRPGPTSLSAGKKFLFASLTLGLFLILLELTLMAVGVRPLLAEKDPLVGFSSQVPLLIEKQVNGQMVMETAPNKLRWFNAQQFPRHKAADTYRVFCVGGSTTFGRPYDDATSFARWLRELLMEAEPNRHWEVINAGGISYASYRVVRVMEELAGYEPDLFVVYTGHNEFLEERTYRELRRLPGALRNLSAILGRTRIYSALDRLLAPRDGPSDAAPSSADTGDVSGELPAEVRTRLDGGVGPDAYRRDDKLAVQVMDHFRFNLQRMVDIAQRSGAEIVLVTPAANLADCTPFKSEHAADVAELAAWQADFDEAERAYARKEFAAARGAIEKALQRDTRHAHSHFLHGRILQALGQSDAARQAFVRARDEDVCALRALSSMIQTVRDVAAERQVELVDYERFVDGASDSGIPGDEMFLDHVHPTIAAHRQLAEALFDVLVRRQVVVRPAAWDDVLRRVVQRVEGEIDPAAHGDALRNLAKVLAWAGKQDEANRLALRASELVGGDAETAYLAGNALLEEGKMDQAIEKFQEALQKDPDDVMALNSLGSAYFRQGQLEAALAQYQRVIPLQPDFAPVHNNLGALYSQRQEWDLAIQHYQEAIRLNPRYSKAYNNVAVLLRKQGRYDEAVQYLRKALQINPDFAEAYFNLGTLLETQLDKASALEHYRRAIRLNDTYGPAYYRLGLLLEDQQQWRAAAQAYRAALRPPAASLEAALRLSWILATCPDDSLRDGRTALKMAQGFAAATKHRHPDGLSALAAAYAEMGDFENATEWQARAVRIAAPRERPEHEARLETLRNRQTLRSSLPVDSARPNQP